MHIIKILLSFLLVVGTKAHSVPISEHSQCARTITAIVNGKGLLDVEAVLSKNLSHTASLSEVRPFDPQKLEKHFDKHKGEFDPPFDTAEAYEQGALNFARSSDVGQYVLIGPQTRRTFKWSELTNEFLVISNKGIVESYFKPRLGIHQYKTNAEYFMNQR